MTTTNRRFYNELTSYISPFDELNDTRKNWIRNINKNSFILSFYTGIDATFVILISNYVIPVYFNLHYHNKAQKIPYPFRPPDIKVGIYDYKSLLRMNEHSFRILNLRCLCCSTLTCNGNWTPQNTLFDLLNEIKRNLELKLRSVEIYHAIKIIDKYFGDAFRVLPIVEYL